MQRPEEHGRDDGERRAPLEHRVRVSVLSEEDRGSKAGQDYKGSHREHAGERDPGGGDDSRLGTQDVGHRSLPSCAVSSSNSAVWRSTPWSSSSRATSRTSRAPVEHEQPVDHRREFCEAVAGDQDGSSGVRPFAELAPQPSDPVDVQACGRLVQHDHLWVTEQRGGQGQPLPGPQRVGAGPAGGDLSGQAHHFQHLVDALPRQAGGGREAGQVLPARAERGQADRVEARADDMRRALE